MSQNLLCDTFVKLNQILSGIFTYTLLGICSFPFFAYSYFCKILGGHINICIEQQISSTIYDLWMNLFAHQIQSLSRSFWK